jgi:hypothetical protein
MARSRSLTSLLNAKGLPSVGPQDFDHRSADYDWLGPPFMPADSAGPEDRTEAIKMDASQARLLDPGRRSVDSLDFEGGRRRKIVGQDEAVQAVGDTVPGISRRAQFAGASGGQFAIPGTDRSRQDARGGSYRGDAFRRSSRGDQSGLRRVPTLACETHPLISQEALAQYHSEKLKISFLLIYLQDRFAARTIGSAAFPIAA